MNQGGELLDPDPWLAKRLLARGLQIEPGESIAWFNLGIGRTSVFLAVRAYRHCLSLPHGKKPNKRRETISHKIYSCLAAGRRDGVTTPSVLSANQTILCSNAPLALATEALWIQIDQYY